MNSMVFRGAPLINRRQSRAISCFKMHSVTEVEHMPQFLQELWLEGHKLCTNPKNKKTNNLEVVVTQSKEIEINKAHSSIEVSTRVEVTKTELTEIIKRFIWQAQNSSLHCAEKGLSDFLDNEIQALLI